jgi:hypothetical protein
MIPKVNLSSHSQGPFPANELWHVRASVTTITFELAIDGFGNKRLDGVNVP